MEIKVYLIANHLITREAYKFLLVEDGSIKIIAETSNIELCDKALLDSANIIMAEYRSPREDFIQQIEKIKLEYPSLIVLVFTGEEDDIETLKGLMQIGVSGYLTKNSTKEELIFCIKNIFNGGLYICSTCALRFIKSIEHFNKKEPTFNNLKTSEAAVLKLIAAGLTNKDIAKNCLQALETIETRRKKILDKTNTTNTATLIKFAVKHGLID